MVRDDLFDLFTQDNINKQAEIAYSGGVMTNTELFQNSEELTESLCSENEMRFGSCEASCFKFKVYGIVKDMIGETVSYSMIVDKKTDSPMLIGKYKVASDKLTADRQFRQITAYDAMYDILNADVAAWYNEALPHKDSALTMKQFRESFLRHFKLSWVVPEGGLVNDGMTVKRTIEPSEISGKDVITAICEINGCFGHIGRDGKFYYIYLPQNIQGLYPAAFLYPDHVPEQWDYLPQAETGHLYPQDPKSIRLGKGTYINCRYEDYVVRQINKLQIRQEENDIGVIYGDGDNCYIIEDNFLVYGKSAEELQQIAKNIFNKITGIIYRPFDCDAVGNPCLEVGDPVRLNTKYDIIESYILKRTLKGVQALRDSYSSAGTLKRSEKVNGIQKSIVQLKGKSNTLERNIEETRLEIKDTEKNLQSEIKQTASEIRTEVKNTTDGLSSRITQNSNSITAEVNRATSAEGNLSSRITINEQGLSTKVTKGTVSSEISQEADKVQIDANRLIVNSSQFALDGNGNATFGGTLRAATGDFSGDITATSGRFDNVTINSSCTVAGQSITGTIGNNVGWNGSTIQNDYIGNLSAGKLTSGTVGRPYSFSGVSLNGNVDASAATGRNYLGNPFVTGLSPQVYGATNIGADGSRFNIVWATHLYGTVHSGSSREIKKNIEKYDTSKCLGVINDTEIVSYNYNDDVRDVSESVAAVLREKEKYIKNVEALPIEEKPDEKEYFSRIDDYENQIAELKHERERNPEIRYGFISEDAPWELVSMDRKTVDTYSAVAMCFGAIQEMAKKIEKLENIIKYGNGGEGNAESV